MGGAFRPDLGKLGLKGCLLVFVVRVAVLVGTRVEVARVTRQSALLVDVAPPPLAVVFLVVVVVLCECTLRIV